MSLTKLDVGIVTGILALAVWVLIPFWRPGIANANDMLCSIYRLFALDASWHGKVFYPRLAPDFAFGYGVPLFQVYAPLTFYIAEFFHLAGLGFIAAIKATFSLGLFLSGLGMYLYGLTIFHSRIGALLAAIAYVYAPYQLLNIYERGASAESFSLALLPWVLWAFYRLYAGGSHLWFLASTGSVAALLLTHNTTGPFFLPVLLSYLLVLYLGQRDWHRLLLCLAAVSLALGLSLFFLFPAIVESKYVNTSDLITGIGDPRSNLRPWHDLIQRTWFFDYWGPQRFRLGQVPALVTLLSLGVLIFQPWPMRRWLIFFVLVLIGALLLQLPIAYVFWDRTPLVSVIQFPWRLLAFVSLSSAVLIGSLPGLAARLIRSPLLEGKRWLHNGTATALTSLVALPLIVTATARLSPENSTIWYQIEESGINRLALYERGLSDFDLFSDYQPIWVQERMTDVPYSRPQPPKVSLPPLGSPPHIHVLEYQPPSISLAVEAKETFPLRFHLFYFPGWQVSVDGRLVPTYTSSELGLVTAEIPPGRHQVELNFGDTFVRQVSTALSLFSLLAYLGIVAWLLRRRPWITGLLGFLLLGGIIAWHTWPTTTPGLRDGVQANLENKALLLGYALDKDSYRPGETARLSLYWLGLQQMPQDYKVFVHLVNERDSQKFGQHDGHPVYGFTPTTRWEPGELVVDEHQVPLGETIPPGIYRLLVGMYRPDVMKNLVVRQAPQVLPGDRIALTQIEIQGK